MVPAACPNIARRLHLLRLRLQVVGAVGVVAASLPSVLMTVVVTTWGLEMVAADLVATKAAVVAAAVVAKV